MNVDFRLLEEMYKMGYDPVVSADLARLRENASIFFRKVREDTNKKSFFFSGRTIMWH